MTYPSPNHSFASIGEVIFSDTLGRADHITRITWVLLCCCSLGLFIVSVYRAVTFPFVHDESLSFSIFNWAPAESVTANNHLLNTVLMRVCSQTLGNSELSLRLPNLLAHVLYLACGLVLLKRVKSPVLMIAGFAFLHLNPFLLDFFFMARGYGLALAFMLLSLYLLTRAYEAKPQQGFVKYLYFSVAAGALAVLANFTLLNFFLPLLLVVGWLLLTDESLRRFSRCHLLASVPMFLATDAFLVFVLSETFRLKKGGHLYSGGDTSFLSDTVGSLVRCSLYSISYTSAIEKNISVVLVGLFATLLLLGIYLCLPKKKVPLFAVIIFILVPAIALPTLQHYLVNTLFPTERAGLFYLPLFALALILAFNWILQLLRYRWQQMLVLGLSVTLAAVVSWHFYRSFNAHTCYTWSFDGHNDEVLEIINRDRQVNFPDRTVNLGNSWVMEPSLNFYRVTRNYAWLEKVTRKPIGVPENDYIYALESEIGSLLTSKHTKLASYPDTQTVLLRVSERPPP